MRYSYVLKHLCGPDLVFSLQYLVGSGEHNRQLLGLPEPVLRIPCAVVPPTRTAPMQRQSLLALTAETSTDFKPQELQMRKTSRVPFPNLPQTPKPPFSFSLLLAKV